MAFGVLTRDSSFRLRPGRLPMSIEYARLPLKGQRSPEWTGDVIVELLPFVFWQEVAWWTAAEGRFDPTDCRLFASGTSWSMPVAAQKLASRRA
ncbi:unnamed protein product [Soboliphyme baturini]|uniref:DUF72 domain-containing protein n=1 Tax=Soboliphyme baturini TaxID=241478 RepID=A0A183II30_9BILA|nr:unnamed protein product [Soboliphyme baturini]